jgi:glutathione S-transferase
MIELIQFPWSPYCLVIHKILEFSGKLFRVTDIPNSDRSLVWRLSHQRYYGVPIIRDGRGVIFETDEESQVIAKYLDDKLQLGLFPWELEGVQAIIWRHIESEIEGLTFKLNDIYWREFVPQGEQIAFLRHKERKFGRGCLDQWRSQQKDLVARLEEKLVPYEEMLIHKDFLLGDRPHFVDFDLYGMLANFLFSGHYRLPAAHNRLRAWHRRLKRLQSNSLSSEKELHSRHQRPSPRPHLAAQVRR